MIVVNMIKRLFRFIKYNHMKSLSIQCWLYSAIYRLEIFWLHGKKGKKCWGIEGEESPQDADQSTYLYALKVAYTVNHVCSNTMWESKCLVRALTAQKLLKKKKIDSTLYLGCGEDEEHKMIAHAWLRCGRLYVSGGDGTGFAVVDKFRVKTSVNV